VYSSQTAVEQATKAKTLSKEAEDLTSQSNDLKSKAASEKNTTSKNAIYAEAEKLASQSEEKQLESAQIIGVANAKEYSDNQNKLNQFVVATKGNTADEISMAEMMKDEAVIYFNRAAESRKIANSATDFYEKETALEDAYKNEMIALEKQKKATDIYLKYTPNIAVKTIDNAIVDNTTKTTDNIVASNAVVDNTTKTVDSTTKIVDNTTKTTDNAVVDNTTKTTDNIVASNAVVDNTTKIVDNTTKTTDNAVVDNTTKTTDNIVASNTVADNTTKTVDNVAVNNTSTTNEVFVKTTAPVYSASKPIPVNEKLPEGLIFKVQIGAFRNPIPQDLFTGMSPITGETTPQGFTRYTAGLFTTFTTADKVKQEIRDLGYKDAFVVAFLNGKRIPMVEAMAMTGGTMPTNNQVTTNTSAIENTTKVVDNTVVTTNANTPVNNSNAQTNTPANTQNIATVGGLFYTVQIGVYSQVVSSSKLYNIQPLYTETAPNGNFRYNTGIYNTVARAVEAKNMIVDVGIKDAFVTAYLNGKRISLPEAEKFLADGSAVFSTASNMNALPTFSASSAPRTTPVSPRPITPSPVIDNPTTTAPVETTTTTPVETSTTTTLNNNQPTTSVATPVTTVVNDQIKAEAAASNVMQIDSGIVFKVQIGAFKEEVPLEIANKFLKIAKKGVKNYKDANGLTIYTVGTYKTYAEAIVVRTEVVNEAAINDAFIVAYKDGNKIAIDEARALSGQ